MYKPPPAPLKQVLTGKITAHYLQLEAEGLICFLNK